MVQNSWKKFDHLKNTVKIYASDYYDINVNKDGLKLDKFYCIGVMN